MPPAALPVGIRGTQCRDMRARHRNARPAPRAPRPRPKWEPLTPTPPRGRSAGGPAQGPLLELQGFFLRSAAETSSRRAVGDRRGAHEWWTADRYYPAAGCFARRGFRADSDSADPRRQSVLLAGNHGDPKRKITQNQTRDGRGNRNRSSRKLGITGYPGWWLPGVVCDKLSLNLEVKAL